MCVLKGKNGWKIIIQDDWYGILIVRWPPIPPMYSHALWYLTWQLLPLRGRQSLFPHSLNLAWLCDLFWVTEHRGSKAAPVPRSQKTFCASTLSEFCHITKLASWMRGHVAGHPRYSNRQPTTRRGTIQPWAVLPREQRQDISPKNLENAN